MRHLVKYILQFIILVCSVLLGGFYTQSAHAELKKVHFLIPGGAGGGWDSTARGVGQALANSKLVKRVSYQNMSGGGGGRAIANLINTARRHQNTLMINSTPFIIRSLQKIFTYTFQDLTPIAAVISDYGVLAVSRNSKLVSWSDTLDQFHKDPTQLAIGGGSGRGSLDHLVVAQIFQMAGADPKEIRYIPYDAGGKAMAGLLSGEIQVLSTGLGEALEQHRAGQIRILAITSEKRSPAIPNVPTFTELGHPAVFLNWRGFFGPPNISEKKVNMYNQILEKMFKTAEWESIRKRNGWQNQHIAGQKFQEFLKQQEIQVAQLMRSLDFLK
ncbi:tripartite tricarboxylate transporter substrate-binding protein [Candidatus Poribacteria bacterium]|nr:tripartite tricarboxylate transporter substrate-binding protein [Candidatus Poribacteria bacterium]OUT64451.1 MAG: transporter [bacterium TMED15]